MGFFYFFLGAICLSFMMSFSKDWAYHQINWTRRSHADCCHQSLSFYDLIPIISFICLRGRCRYCHQKLSYQYVLGEVLGGILFIMIGRATTSFVDFLTYSFILSLLLLMSFIDVHQKWVPDTLQILLLVTLVIRNFKQLNLSFAFFILFILILIAYLSEGQLGGGDIKLLSILALDLGYQAFPKMLALASLLGIIYFMISRCYHKGKIILIPFVPFITLAYYLVYIMR